MTEEKDVERRKLIDLALNAGRKRKSPQTGFIHYCYESSPSEPQDTIPLYENFCYALALLRSRTTDPIKEAKALLEKLLSFEAGGNFPVYLHEYPQCRDHYLSLNLLPVFIFIKDFSSVLGEELVHRLEAAFQNALHFVQDLKRQGLLSKEAEGKLNAILHLDGFENWHPKSISQWGQYLLFLQLAPISEQKKHFEKAASLWHPKLLCYIGPYGKSLQYKAEPAATLFDFFMGSLLGNFPKRVFEDAPLHLQAALIHPFSFSFAKEEPTKDFSFCVHEEGENALTLKWGSGEHLHTLAIPRLKSAIDCELYEDSCKLVFTLPDALPVENEDEAALFIDHHKDNTVWINQKKASLFSLHDTLEIISKKKKVEITFSQEGEGIFSGHLLRANRPFQMAAKGEDLFEAYDWKIGLRTVRRKNDTKLCVLIRMCELI